MLKPRSFKDACLAMRSGKLGSTPLSLSWTQTDWIYDHLKHISHENVTAMKSFSDGWTGYHLHGVSDFEMNAIRGLCVDPRMIVAVPLYDYAAAQVFGELVSASCGEVWLASEDLAIMAHETLSLLPPRVTIMPTSIPLYETVEPMLEGLNYLCGNNLGKDRRREPLTKGVLSIQDHDGIDRLRAILALTQ